MVRVHGGKCNGCGWEQIDVPLGSRQAGLPGLRVACISLDVTPCRAFGRRFGLRGRSWWTRGSIARISGVWPRFIRQSRQEEKEIDGLNGGRVMGIVPQYREWVCGRMTLVWGRGRGRRR